MPTDPGYLRVDVNRRGDEFSIVLGTSSARELVRLLHEWQGDGFSPGSDRDEIAALITFAIENATEIASSGKAAPLGEALQTREETVTR